MTKNLLTSLVIGTGLALVGCGERNEKITSPLYAPYVFDGEIDGKRVNFYQELVLGSAGVLEITEKDGTITSFKDVTSDLKIDHFYVFNGKLNYRITEENYGDEMDILNSKQKEFDEWLKKISEVKRLGERK